MNTKEIKDKRVRLSSLVHDLEKRCIRLARERLEQPSQGAFDKWKDEVGKRDAAKRLVQDLKALEHSLTKAIQYRELNELLK